MTRHLVLLLCIVLAACEGQDPQANAAAQAAAREQAAEEAARGFDAAVSAEEWELARAHGDVLLADFPGTAAAERVAPQHAESSPGPTPPAPRAGSNRSGATSRCRSTAGNSVRPASARATTSTWTAAALGRSS